jgi:hypothetical protein
MTRRRVTTATSLLVLTVLILIPLAAQAQNSGYIRRFLAHKLDGDAEISTTLPPAPGGTGGLVIYNKNFFTANDINTIYVTISATGDDHNGARLQLACLLDNKPCDPESHLNAGGAPSGWFTALRHKNYNVNYTGPGFVGDGGGGAGDLHDNIVHYTWCTPFNGPAGSHNVQIKLASSPGTDELSTPGDLVFLEAVYVFVDGSRVAQPNNSCPVTEPLVDSTVAATPSTATAPDGTLIDTTTFLPLTAPSTLTVPPITQQVIP